jgi:hypothetical protein
MQLDRENMVARMEQDCEGLMTQMRQERETAITGVNGVTGPLAKKGRVLDELVMQDKLSELSSATFTKERISATLRTARSRRKIITSLKLATL